MNASLKALEALITQYGAPQSDELFQQLEKVFTGTVPFLEKVSALDALMAKYPELNPLTEYAFDLLMSFHLDENNEKEEYFESDEWLEIEDKTITRGTELLNILLYVNECENADVEITIEDFLFEFLLVDEDEFQDEHRIYEDVIINQELVEESIDSILSVSRRIDDTSEIYELFVPLLIFFKEPQEKKMSRETYNKLKPLERSLLASMLAYHNG